MSNCMACSKMYAFIETEGKEIVVDCQRKNELGMEFLDRGHGVIEHCKFWEPKSYLRTAHVKGMMIS
jgi:hypothetical protein